LHDFPKPVVAALPGAAAGAGLSIALAADMRIAAPNALLVTAFSSIGASGDFGGSWFMNRLLGEAKAKELYFRSPRLSAAEALDLGLVNEILDDDDFETAAINWCMDLANRAPLAIARMKENLNRASDVDLATEKLRLPSSRSAPRSSRANEFGSRGAPMAKTRWITEMGMGVDVHGGDYTKAARRAVSDALRHSSLNLFNATGKTSDDMFVDVIIGAAEPSQVNCDAVAEEVPYGTVTVVAEKGGLDVVTPRGDDVLIMANAAILVSFED